MVGDISSKPQMLEPKSICILRLSAIGDVCHAVATVQAIQRRFPSANITWIIGKVEKMLLEGMPGIEFIVFDKQTGIQGYKDLRAQLKNRQFDLLLHMQAAFRASVISTLIKAKQKWGFDFRNAREGQWLFTNKKVPFVQEPHVADGFFAFAKAIGVHDAETLKWDMPINEASLAWQNEKLGHLGEYLVISPAASKAERNWLADRYAAIADYAYDRGLNVVICGGPSEMEKSLAKEILAHCQSAPLNLVGETNLKQMLAILKRAKVVLAPDTGPAHMAVTVNTPVIGLYAHSNPKRTGPYLYQDFVVSVYKTVVEEQQSKKLDDIPWGTRARGEELMAKITVEDVKEKLNLVL